MVIVLWAGLALAALGIGLLIWCGLEARRVARGGLDAEAGRAAMRRLMAVNLAGVGLGFLGAGLVAAGALLG